MSAPPWTPFLLSSVSSLGPSANPETKKRRRKGRDDLSHCYKYTYNRCKDEAAP